MYVTNTTGEPPSGWDSCYADVSHIATSSQTVSCVDTAQYVAVYVDKNNGALDDTLNICEVAVNGMFTKTVIKCIVTIVIKSDIVKNIEYWIIVPNRFG